MSTYTITTAQNISDLTGKTNVVAALTWTRSSTTATVTYTAHGFVSNQIIGVTVSSDTAAIVLGAKTITVTNANAFTFTCLNAGGTSGTITINAADRYNINGGTLTIDQDSRYGLNSGVATILDNITISATLGGTLDIDARYVRIIPYDTGSGNVPTADTLITQGSASGKLIGVWSALNAAPTTAGSAMPTSGFIKIRQWNSISYAIGALTGIDATATAVDKVGWIELVGNEASTITVPRLGLCRIRGEWYDVGTTNGTANQQFQLPASLANTYYPGVFIETAVGSGSYEFYPNSGSQNTVATDIRAKVVWVTSQGLLRIGHNGTANAGYLPVTGLKIVIPNIITINSASSNMSTNALPNATLATRYDFTTTGGGVLEIDKCNLAWYPSFSQAYSLTMSNCGINEQLLISEIAAPMTITNVGVGQTANQSQYALSMSLCFAGGTFTNCTWSRATLASTGHYTVYIADVNGFTYSGVTTIGLTARNNATTGSHTIIRAVNCTWTNQKNTNGQMLLTTCTNCSITNTLYCDVISGTTGTSNTMYVWAVGTNCSYITISGLTFLGLTNVQAYGGPLGILAAGCNNIVLRNIGTRVAPLTLGATNGGAYLVTFATGAAASNVRIQRCYVSSTRSGLWSSDNSSTQITIENCAGDYADAPVMASLNMLCRANGCSQAVTAQTAIYGTHFADCFTSTTAGRIMLLANEKTSLEPSTSTYTITSGTPNFTSAGGLYMPVIGQQIEYTMPYYALGHTSFANALPTMAGGTLANYTIEFKIDKNDGNGFSANWTTATAANLFAISGINASLGFKLKVRITTAVTNTTAITSLYFTTVSTTTAQDYQYPLDVATLTFTGLVSGTEIHAYLGTNPDTVTELASVESSGTSYSFTHSAGGSDGYITFIKLGYTFLRVPITYSSSDTSIPIFQTIDRSYQNL